MWVLFIFFNIWIWEEFILVCFWYFNFKVLVIVIRFFDIVFRLVFVNFIFDGWIRCKRMFEEGVCDC